MNIFEVIGMLYTKKDSEWIKNLDEYPSPVILIKFLGMNYKIGNHVRYLDKYVFNLSPQHFLYLAWSILPKSNIAPYNKYIKKVNIDEDIYSDVLIKIRNLLELSDNDYFYVKKYIINDISKDKIKWFKTLGMGKDVYKKHGLNYNNFIGEIKVGKKGLELFGM